MDIKHKFFPPEQGRFPIFLREIQNRLTENAKGGILILNVFILTDKGA